MKKLLLVLVSILLLTGVSYAVDMDQSITNALAVQNKGHSVVTDSSAAIKIWCLAGGAAHPALGVSSSTSLIIYENVTAQTGHTIATGTAAYDTVGEVVDFINTNLSSDSSVRIFAEVGADARRASSTRTLEPANYLEAGLTQDSSTAIAYLSTNGRLSAGVEGKSGRINRLKSFNCTLTENGVTGGITYTIYDGNTAVWSKYVAHGPLITAADVSNSANTIVFPDEKGISATKGNSIMVEAVTENISAATSADEKSANRVSIVYDQLAQ